MKQKLITENMKLVYFVINKYYPHLNGDEDMIQAGMVGLCLAADNFDEDKAQFSTYACSCIAGEILKEIRSRKKHNGVLSLDFEYDGEDDTITLADLVEGVTDRDVIENTNISMFLDTLTDREQQIVVLRRQGYTTNEVADELGVSQSLITQISRAINRKWRKYNGH